MIERGFFAALRMTISGGMIRAKPVLQGSPVALFCDLPQMAVAAEIDRPVGDGRRPEDRLVQVVAADELSLGAANVDHLGETVGVGHEQMISRQQGRGPKPAAFDAELPEQVAFIRRTAHQHRSL